MNGLREYLKNSYTCFQAVENGAKLLADAGFTRLTEQARWKLAEGGTYFVTRGGSLIAFRYSTKGTFRIVASHTDSPCLKLKENPAASDGTFTRLNTEPYGGGLWYTFFDRPLVLAGRRVEADGDVLVSKNFVSDFHVVIPSLAIHQNREANDKFAPNLQTELPLVALGKREFADMIGGSVAYDLFVTSDVEPFESGASGEFFSAPRIDNLSSVYSSLTALVAAKACEHTQIAACFDAEEIGSHTRGGAGADLMRSVLERIAEAQSRGREEQLRAYASSLLVSLDNAHSLHPNHPEKCDPTNRAVLGGGIVIKGHAGGAYTTDGMTSAIIKKIFRDAGVKHQTFFNRSDVRSGSTLGAISLSQVSIPSVDLGLAQLAMHSAVETIAKSDYAELERGLAAFYKSDICFDGDTVTVK